LIASQITFKIQPPRNPQTPTTQLKSVWSIA
jgi:hypothetical protein